MNILIENGAFGGTVRAPASKSAAHRLLICAALAQGETELECSDVSKDIAATAHCLNALGARIERTENGFSVIPVDFGRLPEKAVCRCGESGSTFRFLIPVAAALGIDTDFLPEGRLPQRPLSPLYEELIVHGTRMSAQGSVPFSVRGKLTAGDYALAANVSSQFISGLLFALPLAEGESRIRLTGKFESRSYVDMTVGALRLFGVPIGFENDTYTLSGCEYHTPGFVRAEGDWSNAAFWLCAGVTGSASVTVTGLSSDSLQGDRAIVDILKDFGARIETDCDRATVYPSQLRAIRINAENIPDLVPVLAVTACAAEGETVIYNAARLRLKESDRLNSVCALIRSLGGEARETDDGLVITGKILSGGVCDSFGDHRIAMSAAVASIQCGGNVTVTGAEAVGKSYPRFWADFAALGGRIKNGYWIMNNQIDH
ncbi:MAG: 3-phosphoshikimate 1-carboxyvinyltransferase [Clostridia bacterium]|nr:3-phosphoshikimate 1-carboxyvinyltransferase [Clostridia bacterium]